jgi:hypothetical protein
MGLMHSHLVLCSWASLPVLWRTLVWVIPSRLDCHSALDRSLVIVKVHLRVHLRFL